MNTPRKPDDTPAARAHAAQESVTGRLPHHPAHKVRFEDRFAFEFNGKYYYAFAGDTIASALWASGERVLGRSFKYHRPRAPFAFTSGDCNTLVRVDDEPNVRPAVTLVKPGMVVKSQNVWPTLGTDLMSLTALGARLMPVGFYYKTFIRPKALWPAYEKILRHAAGLGYVTRDAPDTYYDKKYDFADVVVIGGGPAGMSAALSAAETGARVLLLEENPYLGGHLAYERHMVETKDETQVPAYDLADQLAQQVLAQDNIQVELNTNAFGIYQHHWLGAEKHGTRLLKIRAKSLVIANGAFEQPLLFHNNDLPGVILGSAAQRLAHLYGVRPGKQAVVLSANRDGLQVALDLHTAGLTLAAVVDLRPAPDEDLVTALQWAGIKVRTNCLVTQAKGGRDVKGVVLAQVDTQTPITTGSLRPKRGSEEVVPCDLLVTSAGWTPATGLLYQAKAKLAYDEQRGEFLPVALPPKVHAAGRVTGTHRVKTEILEGELAGLNAAAEAGFGQGASEALEQAVAGAKESEAPRTSKLIYASGDKVGAPADKSFLSFDEDVTIKDVRDAVAEGYQSMELLKRYSTLSMGPSQGKYESANTMALAAEANQQTIAETGTTTSRPPFSPVPLGVLAGRMMEPVKYTPMHAWHIAQGATMMNAGLWKRPDHYGQPETEVRTTRNHLGLIDVGTLGKISLRGPDVPKLLEMLYVNRWRKLDLGRARYGVMCNEEGVVSDDGVTAHLAEDSYYMTTTSSGVTAVYENILWNLQSGWQFAVHVNNMTDTYTAMNLTGPQARAMLQPLTDIDLANEAFPYMSVRQGLVAGVQAIVLRIGFTGELGYELHVPAGYGLYLWETLMAAGQAYGITPFGVEAQRIMRLEKGHFIVGQDTDALTDPFMAHLDWAVKLDKPDFVGRPSLVRAQKRGDRQKLVGYQMLDPQVVPEEANQIVRPNPEAPIGLEIIGRITSSRYSPTLKEAIGLCWLPSEQSEPGTEFTVRVQGELHQGRVVPLPFYDPQGARLRG